MLKDPEPDLHTVEGHQRDTITGAAWSSWDKLKKTTH